MAMTTAQVHYRRPGFFTRNVFNKAVAGLTRMGISVWGSRILEVRGRSTGATRRTPVNLLTLDGVQYLVSPRGHSNWVRNVRADGGNLVLVLGRRHQAMVGQELDDGDKVAVMRAYLRRWKAEVGIFFEGVGPDSSDEEIAAIAPKHPVFRLSPAAR